MDNPNYICDDASEDVEDEAEDDDGHGEDLISQTMVMTTLFIKALPFYKQREISFTFKTV